MGGGGMSYLEVHYTTVTVVSTLLLGTLNSDSRFEEALYAINNV